MEHVNAAYESIVGSPRQYERKTYLDGLQEAKRSVAKQEKALKGSPMVPFNKHMVFFGFIKSYITIYIFGHAPHEFPAWNALQMLVLFPVTAYRWAKLKWLVFFTEFCWVSNLFLAGYCITLHIRPALVPPEHRTTMTHFFFAVAAGPLQAAVVLLGNALVPHSADHMMSLLIHLQPAMTAYCLRWLDVDRELFPIDPSVDFQTYALPPVIFLLIWAILHATFFIVWGLELGDKGYATTFHFNLSGGKGNNIFTKVLGKLGDGSDRVRFIRYECFSIVCNALTLCSTYVLFRSSMRIHFCVLGFVGTMSSYNGASWYAYRFTKFSKELDRLIADAKKDE